ncbi:MAG: AAA family ATPase, partial [Myxococcales bacterium]|nr:AAA family ATPase [Myxococcales bacterium]
RQAQKAERYKRYREELRDVDLWTSSHRFLELEVTGRILEARRSDLAEQVDTLKKTLAGHEARIEPQRLTMLEREEALKAAQQRVFDLENRLQVGEAEEGFRRREQESTRQAVSQGKAEAAAVEHSLETLEAELNEAREQLELLEESEGSGGSEETLERYEAEHEDLNLRLRNARADVEQGRSERGRLETQAASVRATLASRADAIIDLEQRLSGLADEREGIEANLREAAEELERATTSREAAEIAVEELQARRAELDRERQTLREEVKRSEVELDTVRGELQRARSRLQSLEEIQNRYRGCASGVQVVMDRRDELAHTVDGGETLGVSGIMADYIAAPAELEPAVSAILGDRLQGVVVDAPQVGVHGVELLKEVQEGRTSFLPKACRGGGRAAPRWSAPERPPVERAMEVVDLSGDAAGEGASAASGLLDVPGVRGRLVDLVEVNAELRPLASALLGDAVVVDRLSRALELWQAGTIKATLVTTDGDRIEPSGVIVGGSANALDSALLQQKREIRELGEIVAGLEEDLERARARNHGLAERLATVESEREASEARLLEAERTRIAHVEEARRLERASADLSKRLEGFDRDRDRLRETLEKRQGEQGDLEEALAKAETRLPELEELQRVGEATIESLTEQRDRVGEMLTEAKVARARWQQQLDALRGTKGRLERQATSERERARRLAQHAAEGEARIGELEQAIAAAKEERAGLLDQHVTAVQAGHDAREAYDSARVEVEGIEQAIRNLRGKLDEERERLREVEMGVKELSLELGHLRADILERFDVALEEVLVDFHDRPRASDAEAARVKELKRLLGRMGEVNLTAIDEFEEVSERFEYLSAQKKDLVDAISQLEEAIDKINKTTRDRFSETFKAVNEMFEKLFPRLFNGGKASLKLTDPSDLLGTGVEIIAQPPGKQVRSLELLSGGEKALTATSLIFAIFLIKPSPFCLLDEVDAPLDEANVGRFSNMVKELAERTQFIIITHNKRTMEAADRLYGVTMEQRGVSKLVSVNMRRAVELAS